MGVERLPTESDGAERKGGRKHEAEGVRSKRRRLGPDQGEVGQALRSVYDDMVNEGVPDDLLKLLGQLD